MPFKGSSHQINLNSEDGDINLLLPLWFQSTKAYTLSTFAPYPLWILLCSSPFMNMHILLELPQLWCSGRHCFGEVPVSSSLAESSNSFLLPLVGSVVTFGSTPRGKASFPITVAACSERRTTDENSPPLDSRFCSATSWAICFILLDRLLIIYKMTTLMTQSLKPFWVNTLYDTNHSSLETSSTYIVATVELQ